MYNFCTTIFEHNVYNFCTTIFEHNVYNFVLQFLNTMCIISVLQFLNTMCIIFVPQVIAIMKQLLFYGNSSAQELIGSQISNDQAELLFPKFRKMLEAADLALAT